MKINMILEKGKGIRFTDIIRFVMPAYFTTLFTTLYTIVDGLFVAAYVGETALAVINIVYPLVNVISGIALAFSVGGSALASIAIGSSDKKKASMLFSSSLLAAFIIGMLVSTIVIINIEKILMFLGATSSTIKDCRTYALIWLLGYPVVLGKEILVYFIRANGFMKTGFFISASGGIANIFLDYVFVAVLRQGIFGAGIATLLGLCISCLFGLVVFARWQKILSFHFQYVNRKLALACGINGISDFVDQIAVAITTIVFNRTALYFAGENGIAAVSIIMYLQFVFTGIYFGYSTGLSPLMSHAYGQKNRDACHRLEKLSIKFLIISPLILLTTAYFLAPYAVSLFIARGDTIYQLTVHGMRLYSLGYIFTGFNIFASTRSISYGLGKFAGIITGLRSFVLLLIFLYFLPLIYGVDGLWLSFPCAEGFTVIVSFMLSKKCKLPECDEKNILQIQLKSR